MGFVGLRFAGGVAVIRVGAPSEAEMKAKKDALDDAISATHAAVAEGIIPGGGLALLRATEAVAAEEAKAEGDERTGIQILRRALEAPTRAIADNSAVDDGVVVARMLAEQGTVGFDAAAKAARAKGAAKVYAAATHGLFLGEANRALAKPAIDHIVVTNSVPPFRLDREIAARKLTVLDVSELFAETIRRMHEGDSVSELLGPGG